MSGRASCLLKGGLCLKTFTKGSYFGDIDALNHMRRLFTVRAEEPLKLAVLTLKRYISYLQALKKIKHFFKVSRTNEWWDDAAATQNVKPINCLVEEWLNMVVDIESHKKQPSYSFFTQQVRT